MRYLIFDTSNLLYRTFHAEPSGDHITVAGLAHHAALITANKYFHKFKPHKVIMAFDQPSWRIDYTKTDDTL